MSRGDQESKSKSNHKKEFADRASFEFNSITKGYHECPFTVEPGEEFLIQKKYGAKGQAFKISNHKGQLGPLERRLVGLLWPVNDQIKCVVTGQPFNDPGGRWRVGGGINLPIKVKFQTTKVKAKQLK